ncbi:MAG: hypothetical protein R3C28_23920 [Pirellulaceae bacterium]
MYHANFSLEPYAELLTDVARLKREIPSVLGLEDKHEMVHLYLFQNQNTYQAYLTQYFPTAPNRRALFIKQRGPGMVFAYAGQDFEIDLRHESTHAVLHSMLPMVPLWLDEGLAEYFELPAEQRTSKNPHLRRVQWNLKWGRAPDLQELEALTDLSQMTRDDYRDAWAWIHFLLHGPEAVQKSFQAYLADIQRQVPPGKLEDRLRQASPNVNQQFLQHMRSWRFDA